MNNDIEKLREAAQQALEALEEHGSAYLGHETPYSAAISALRQALEQEQEPEQQEPVVTAFDVKIDGRALQVLDGMVSPSVDGDRNPVRMIAGEGNSGYGLYISREDWSEDDATLLAEIPPLYTAPSKREWVGLSDKEIEEISGSFTEFEGFKQGALWAEQKLKELNA